MLLVKSRVLCLHLQGQPRIAGPISTLEAGQRMTTAGHTSSINADRPRRRSSWRQASSRWFLNCVCQYVLPEPLMPDRGEMKEIQ